MMDDFSDEDLDRLLAAEALEGGGVDGFEGNPGSPPPTGPPPPPAPPW